MTLHSAPLAPLAPVACQPGAPGPGQAAAPQPCSRFAALGAPYLVPVPATLLPAPQRLWGNQALAAELQLGVAEGGWRHSDATTAILAGNRPWPGYPALASVYAGHQVGSFTRRLCDGRAPLLSHKPAEAERQARALGDAGHATLRQRFADPAALDAWAGDWQARLARQAEPLARVRQRLRAANPKFILRKHLAQTAIAAAEAGELGALQRLCRVLEHPFDDQPGARADADPPPAGADLLEVSCSS